MTLLMLICCASYNSLHLDMSQPCLRLAPSTPLNSASAVPSYELLEMPLNKIQE